MDNKKIFPLFSIDLFLIGTYMIYRYGIWVFPYRDDVRTLLFIIGCVCFFSLRYILSIIYRKSPKSEKLGSVSEGERFFVINVIICAILMVPYSLGRTGSLYPHIIDSLHDMPRAYFNAAEANNLNLVIHILSALAQATFTYLQIQLFLNWEKHSSARLIAVVEIIWFLLVNMSTGHNKGVAIFCLITCILFIVYCSGESVDIHGLSFRLILVIISFLVTALFFCVNMNMRSQSAIMEYKTNGKTVKQIELESFGDSIIDTYGYKEAVIVEQDIMMPGYVSKSIVDNYNRHAKTLEEINPHFVDEYAYAYVDSENWLFRILGPSARVGVVQGIYYLVHGYHAVSIGLRIPFDSCYGFCTHWYFMDKASRLFNQNIYERSYIYKVNQMGYPVSTKWGTAYLQLASDISFPGVLIFMLILGAFVAQLWMMVLYEKDFLSQILFTLVIVNILFITSWYQAGTSGSNFIELYLPLTIWIVRKIYYIQKRRLVLCNGE